MNASLLWFCVLLGFAVAAHAQDARVTDRTAAIRTVHRQLAVAVERNDAVEMAALFTDDGMLLPPNRAPLVGREAVRAFFQRIFDGNTVKLVTVNVEEVIVAAEWAAARDSVVEVFQPKTGGEPRYSSLKHLYVLRAARDGTWRIARMMWNSSPPLQSPVK